MTWQTLLDIWKNIKFEVVLSARVLFSIQTVSLLLPWLRVSRAFPRFSVLFLSCKANARVKLAKSGHGPHLFKLLSFVLCLSLCCAVVFMLFCCYYVVLIFVLLCYYLCCPMYWLCVLYHCHRVLTQLQLTNISISILSHTQLDSWIMFLPWTKSPSKPNAYTDFLTCALLHFWKENFLPGV